MLQMYWETHLGSQLFASCQASASLFSLLNLSWCYRATILGIWACVNLSISARVVSETVTSCSICSSYDNEKDFILITNSSSFYVICILGERMRSRCTAKADTVCAPVKTITLALSTITTSARVVQSATLVSQLYCGQFWIWIWEGACLCMLSHLFELPKGWCHTACLLRRRCPRTLWAIISIADASWLVLVEGSRLVLPANWYLKNLSSAVSADCSYTQLVGPE